MPTLKRYAQKENAGTTFRTAPALVKRGFDDVSGRMATRAELLELRAHLDVRLKGIVDSLERLERDGLDAQTTLRPLARAVPEHEERLRRLERKVGLAK